MDCEAHLLLPLSHKPTKKAKTKEPNLPRSIIIQFIIDTFGIHLNLDSTPLTE